MDEKVVEQLRNAAEEHKRKMETDPEYSRKMKEMSDWIAKHSFGKDTPD